MLLNGFIESPSDGELSSCHRLAQAGVTRFMEILEASPEVPERKIGAEFESHLVSLTGDGFALAPLEDFNRSLPDPRLKPEIGRAQFEYCMPPAELSLSTISCWEAESRDVLCTVAGLMEREQIVPLQLGLPPVVTTQDLTREMLFHGRRFDYGEREWSRRLQARTDSGLILPSLNGFSPIDLGFAGVRSALQLHIDLPKCPIEAARYWNAALLITAPVLAAFTASPLFLNRPSGDLEVRIRLWEELEDFDRGRVFLGPGWVRSADEVLRAYAEKPFLYLGEDLNCNDPLRWLRIQVKNLWPHLRLIPESAAGATHWRIENRAFPALPPRQSAELAAMYYSLLNGVLSSTKYRNFDESLRFSSVEENFYSAAREGLDGKVTWRGGVRTTFRELFRDELSGLAGIGSSQLEGDNREWLDYLQPACARAIDGETIAHRMLNAHRAGSLNELVMELLSESF